MKRVIFTVLTARWWLVFFTLVCIAAGGVTLDSHFDLLFAAASLAAEDRALIAVSDDIALILVGFGVWLEERHLFMTKLIGPDMPAHEEIRNDQAESYGAYMLVLGLIMEIFDQFGDLILQAGDVSQRLDVWTMVAMHLIAIALMLRFLWIAAVEWGRPAGNSPST